MQEVAHGLPTRLCLYLYRDSFRTVLASMFFFFSAELRAQRRINQVIFTANLRCVSSGQCLRGRVCSWESGPAFEE